MKYSALHGNLVGPNLLGPFWPTNLLAQYFYVAFTLQSREMMHGCNLLAPASSLLVRPNLERVQHSGFGRCVKL